MKEINEAVSRMGGSRKSLSSDSRVVDRNYVDVLYAKAGQKRFKRGMGIWNSVRGYTVLEPCPFLH